MKLILLILSIGWAGLPLRQSPLPAYQIFDQKGKAVDYADLLEAAASAELVLFGELHDNPIAHWLELELTQSLYAKKEGNVLLGAEMFETDNQLLLNEYLSGQIRQKNFEEEAKLWPNYKTDYKPLVEFAKENNTGFVATNIPRRYASMVFHKGLPSLAHLSEAAKTLLPPLPIEVDLELPGYKALLGMGGEGHSSQNFPHAQAAKDACMGYFITKNLPEDGTFIHYNGTYHSNGFEGIHWYVQYYRPETQTLTIATVTQSEISQLSEENIGIANFVICVPESMTRTY